MVIENQKESPSQSLEKPEDPVKKISGKMECMTVPETNPESAIKDEIPNLLLDMPDPPMREILGNLDFIAVQILRKVCHPLRDSIDKQKIDPKFTVLFVTFGSNHITLGLYLKTILGDETEFVYEEAGNDTKIVQKTYKFGSVIRETPAKMIKNANFVDIFCHDLQVLTENSKTIPSFFIKFKTERVSEKLIEKFQNILKNQNFETNSLTFTIHSPSQLLSILSFFDSQFLKNLTIKNSRETIWRASANTLDMEGIEDLKQWKQLEKVTVERFTIKDSTMLTHLKEGSAIVQKITKDHLKNLIESFRHTPNFSKMALKYPFDELPRILGDLGNGYFQDDTSGWTRRLWFFRMPDNENYVLCVETEANEITFSSYERKNVPAGVGVKNRVFE